MLNRTNFTVSSEQVTKMPNSIKDPEGGASLLYVVTFCSSLFGPEAGLSYCRNQMLSKVKHIQSKNMENNPNFSVQLIYSTGLIKILLKIRKMAKR